MSAAPPEAELNEDIFDVALPLQPYPGLRPFEKSEWPIFFGREVVTNDVIERLISKQFLALHGDSGCGKSSLIRAGVMPRLERDHARGGATWRTTSMLPRNAPLRNLAEALARLEPGASDPERVTHLRRILNYGPIAGGYLSQALRKGPNDYICLLVDQFEEIFHLAEREQTEEARQFVELIVGLQCNPPPGLHVVLTMRSEFLGACARYEGLAEAFNETQFLLPRMDKQSLVRALREPARLYGGEIDGQLLEVLIADAGHGQDQLPLMQHAMMLLQRRKSQTLADPQSKQSWTVSLADYRSAGGVSKLLSDHADSVADGIVGQSSDPRLAERVLELIFRSLTSLDTAGRGVRRPRTLGELARATGSSESDVIRLLQPMCIEGVSFLKIEGLPPYSSSELVDISHEALIRNWDRLAVWMEDEKRFRIWDEDVRRDLADWAGILAGEQSSGVSREATVDALLSQRSAHPDVATVGDNALLIGPRLTKSRYWLNRNPQAVNPEIRSFIELSEAVQAHRGKLGVAWSTDAVNLNHDNPSTREAGLDVFIMYSRADIEVVDRMVSELERRGLSILTDRGAISSGEDWSNRISELITNADVIIFAVSPHSVSSSMCNWEITEAERLGKRLIPVLLSPTDQISTPAALSRIHYFDLTAMSGTQVAVLDTHTGSVLAASFSPDGKRVVTGSTDKIVRIWDVASRAEIMALAGHTSSVHSVSFSRDGRLIVTASDDNTARLWNAESGAGLAVLKAHTGSVIAASISPDGKRVITSSSDNTARLWDAGTGIEIAVLDAHTNWVRAASFSPDGKRVVTGSDDNTARLWDAESGVELSVLRAHTSAVLAVAYSPDGKFLVTGSSDNTARVWDVESQTTLATLRSRAGDIWTVAFSPDSRRVVTGCSDSTARIWDAASGAEITLLKGHTGSVWAAAFSPDGRCVVTASDDKTVRLWDAQSGAQPELSDAFDQLAGMLQTDVAWLREHRNILQRAEAWSRNGCDPDGLMRGSVLRHAELWAVSRPASAPGLTDSQRAYMEASRSAEDAAANSRRRDLDERERLVTQQQEALAREAAATAERDVANTEALRSARRVTRVTFAGALAASALTVLATAAGVYAWQQRQVAAREANEARAARTVADKNFSVAKQAAEELVAQIVKASGELGGQVKTTEELLRKARAIFDKLADAEPLDLELQDSRARIREQFGDTYLAQGNLAASLESYRNFLTLAEKIAAAEPSKVLRARNISAARVKIGDVLVAQGNLPDGLASYQAGLVVAERLTKLDPSNALWQRDLSILSTKLGDVLVAQGDLSEAVKRYKAGFAIVDRLVKIDPGNVEWQRGLSVSHNKIGEVLMAQGHLGEALDAFRASLAIAERLAQSDPGNAGWQRDLSISHDKMGDVLIAQGNLPAALDAFKASLSIAERLARVDSGNAGWQSDLSGGHRKIGDALIAQGNLPAALDAFTASLAIAERLAQADTANTGWQRDLAVIYGRVGDVLRAQGNYPGAAESYRASLAIAERLAKADPGNAGWQRDLAVSHGRVGDVLRERGALEAAIESYRASLAIAERLAKSDPGNAGWQRDLAVSYGRIGEVLRQKGSFGEAAPLLLKSLAIDERLLGPDHPEIGTALTNLAALYSDQGRFSEAESLYGRSLAIWEKTLGPQHPSVAASLNNLARIYLAQGRVSEAEPIIRRSLEINERSLGGDHPAVAAVLQNLATLYFDQQRYADAEQLLKRSIAIREAALGPRHPDLLRSLSTLAEVYRSQNRVEESETLLGRVKELQRAPQK